MEGVRGDGRGGDWVWWLGWMKMSGSPSENVSLVHTYTETNTFVLSLFFSLFFFFLDTRLFLFVFSRSIREELWEADLVLT